MEMFTDKVKEKHKHYRIGKGNIKVDGMRVIAGNQGEGNKPQRSVINQLNPHPTHWTNWTKCVNTNTISREQQTHQIYVENKQQQQQKHTHREQ